MKIQIIIIDFIYHHHISCTLIVLQLTSLFVMMSALVIHKKWSKIIFKRFLIIPIHSESFTPFCLNLMLFLYFTRLSTLLQRTHSINALIFFHQTLNEASSYLKWNGNCCRSHFRMKFYVIINSLLLIFRTPHNLIIIIFLRNILSFTVTVIKQESKTWYFRTEKISDWLLASEISDWAKEADEHRDCNASWMFQCNVECFIATLNAQNKVEVLIWNW